MAAALQESTAFDFLGEEAIGPRHFSLDPAVTRIARFRTQGPSGARYFTVRLSADGRMRAVMFED
jgi:hypothetical protein